MTFVMPLGKIDFCTYSNYSEDDVFTSPMTTDQNQASVGEWTKSKTTRATSAPEKKPTNVVKPTRASTRSTRASRK